MRTPPRPCLVAGPSYPSLRAVARVTASANFAGQTAAIARGAAPVCRVGNLTARRDLTDVRDTVGAYDPLMAKAGRGEVYNVCRGEAFEMRAVLDGPSWRYGQREVEVASELLRPAITRPRRQLRTSPRRYRLGT